MRVFLLLCCFFMAATAAVGQQSGVAPFLGHWQGTLYWYKTGSKQPQTVKMQLVIRPTDTAHVYTWQIIYGNKLQDNRPYLLKAVDTAKGHWQIDEQNGIVIDQYLVANRFTSAFTVQSTTIMDSYALQGKTLVAEFYSLSAKPVSTTGKGTDESPRVESYETKAYQRAVLRKQRN